MKVGTLLVHDVRLVAATFTSPSKVVKTFRMGVRRVNGQEVRLSVPSGGLIQTGSAACFGKVGTPCGGAWSPTVNNTGPVVLTQGSANVSSPKFNFASVADRSAFRFVATDLECSALKAAVLAEKALSTQLNGLTAGQVSRDVDPARQYSSAVAYKMYKAILSQHFLDNASTYSAANSNAGTVDLMVDTRKAYRMCLYPQGLSDGTFPTYNSNDGTNDANFLFLANHWVDYPDVKVYPVATQHATLTTQSDKWASATASQCPLGVLGCKCTSGTGAVADLPLLTEGTLYYSLAGSDSTKS